MCQEHEGAVMWLGENMNCDTLSVDVASDTPNQQDRFFLSFGSRASVQDLSLSFSGRTPIRNSIGSSRRPTFGITPSRGSASEVSLSDPIKAEEPERPITLADIALSDLDIINDPEAGYEEKKESRERLNLIFSNTKDMPYYESLRKKFTEKQSALMRELRLAALIKHITGNVIAQKKLWLENLWQEYVITVVESIICDLSPSQHSENAICADKMSLALPAKENDSDLYNFLWNKTQKIELLSLLSNKKILELEGIVEEVKKLRIAVQTRVCRIKVNFFDDLIQAGGLKPLAEIDQNNVYGILDRVVQKEVEEYAQSLLSATVKLISDADVRKNLKYDLIRYLSFLIKRDKLVENLSDKKNIEELETIKNQCIAIDVDENHSVFLVSAQDYKSIQVPETVEHHYQQLLQNVDSPSDDQKLAAAHSKLELMSYIDDSPQLKEIGILSDWSIEDLSRYHDLWGSTEERIEKQKIEADEQILRCDQFKVKNMVAFENQPVVQKAQADAPLIMKVIEGPMDVLYEDHSEQNALDKSILSKEFSLIIQVLTYAKDNTCLDKLLSLTLNKIAGCGDKASFLLLIACTWLFAPQARGENLFNPSYVDTIRQLSYRDFSQNYFSTLFNPFNEPVLNPTELVEIARQLFDASNNLDHKNISMPAVVWQALKERQLPHERFEKLAHFYKEAIIHVIKKCKNYPSSELYKTKINLLLNTLYHYAKTAYPLEEAVVYIANALIASNSTLALRQPVCIPDPYVLNKTQRLILKARNSLPKEGSCPSLQLSSVYDAPAEDQIQEMLNKLQGADKEQEYRQKESVCNALMKEKQSWLPSFFSAKGMSQSHSFWAKGALRW